MRKYVSYPKFELLCTELVHRIPKYVDCCVLGIRRGGLPIAVHLSHKLDLPLIVDEREAVKFCSVLLVDDIVDSGDTMSFMVNRLKQIIPGGLIVTASLYFKPCSKYVPNFFTRTTEDWIVFPWENNNSKEKRDNEDK